MVMRTKRSADGGHPEGGVPPRYAVDPSGLLVRALLAANTPEACARLLDDLCTVNEVFAMTQRLEVARMLGDGVTYQDIEHHTGASTATISRVNRALLYGAQGYKNVLVKIGGQPTDIKAKGE